MKYEVTITYSGTDTYVVEADTKEAAETAAEARFANGEPADHPGAERIDNFETSELEG
jgi:hypothetical protein